MSDTRKRRSARHVDGTQPAHPAPGTGEQAPWQPPDAYDPPGDTKWAEDGFRPAPQYDPLADAQLWEDTQPPLPQNPVQRSPVWGVLVLILLLALGGMAFYVYTLHRPSTAFRQQAAWMRRNTFFDGIFVDGTHIGGLTYLQAQQQLSHLGQQDSQRLALNVEVDGRQWQLTAKEVPFTRNINAVLDKAYAIGRQGFSWVVDGGDTPFQTRFLHTQQTLKEKAHLGTKVTYDVADVRRVAEQITSQVNRPPVNAVISTFDFNTRAFTVTQDVKGAKLETETLYNSIKAALDKGDYTGTVVVQVEAIMPQVTSVELQNGFAMMSTCTTDTTVNANRNNNIMLAANAINGTSVLPGDTFSFNRATGERTTAKGYLPAPAIADGTTRDEPGGGVCQVSSTLFNAVAMADMTITVRSPHAWPSNYIDKGLDATVNWPNLDFQFRNDKKTPVFLIAYYKGRKLTVEVYGMRSGPGETIKLVTDLISTTEPPKEALYEQNPALPMGTEQVKKKARTGYLVHTYRVYLRDGQEYRREKLFNSDYRAIQQVIEFN